MNGTQMILVIGGLVLFSILIINVNRSISGSEDQEISTEFISTATAVGQSLINEISAKSFDESTTTNPTADINLLTHADLLGPESGETLESFNDVDDYNNYFKIEQTPRTGNFDVNVDVNYVNEGNFSSIINTVSRVKRVRVAVKSTFMPDTLFLYYYKSY